MFWNTEILWYDLMNFYKHVQTCQNSMIRFDTILKTCPDLLKYYDTIWYDSTNMSRLVIILGIDMIWYDYKTCQDLSIMLQFDTILYVTNMFELVLNYKMTKFYEI